MTRANLLRAADVGLSLKWFMEEVIWQTSFVEYQAKSIRPTHEDWQAMIAPLYTYYEAQGSGFHHNEPEHKAKLDRLAISIICDFYKDRGHSV